MVEPAEGPFDDPSLGKQDEPLHVIRPLHDLQNTSATDPFHPENELSRIPSIRPDERECAKKLVLLRLSQDELGTVSVLNVGSMDNEFKDETERINEDMSLPSDDLLAGIVAVLVPLFSVVFTVWLSIEPAVWVQIASRLSSVPSCAVRRAWSSMSRPPTRSKSSDTRVPIAEDRGATSARRSPFWPRRTVRS